jgi:WD40 repeat protein
MHSRFKRWTSFTLLLVGISLSARAQKPELIVQKGHSGGIHSIAISPDGRLLAATDGSPAVIWDTKTGLEIATLKGHSSSVRDVAFSPDGKLLATASYDKTVKLWDVRTAREVKTLNHSDLVEHVAFSPGGKRLASGGGSTVFGASPSNPQDTSVRMWDIETGTELFRLKGPQYPLGSIAFSSDGKLIATGWYRGLIKLWNAESGIEVLTLRELAREDDFSETVDSVFSLAFSPDGTLLASGHSGYQSGSTRLWDVRTGKQLRTLGAQPLSVRELRFSPDGRLLAVATERETILLWDVLKEEVLRTVDASVRAIAFSSDGSLVSGNSREAIEFRDVTTGQVSKSFKGQQASVATVDFSSDGKSLATGDRDGSFRLWRLGSSLEVINRKAHKYGPTHVRFSPDGSILASAGARTVKLWDVASGTELRTLAGHTDEVTSVAFSRNGKQIVSGSDDATARVWDVNTGATLQTLSHNSFSVYTVAISPVENLVATGGNEEYIRIWNAETGRVLHIINTKANWVSSVAFSRDGKTLVSTGYNETMRGVPELWDVETGKEAVNPKLEGDSRGLKVGFSPDGKTLASATGSMRLWDFSTGKILGTFENTGLAFAFSPNAKLIASASDDLKIRDATDGRELARLITVGETDWAVITPDGLFDGTPAAWNRIIWGSPSIILDYAPVEAYFNDYFYPGLLQEILEGNRPEASANIALKDRRQPSLKLSVVGGSARPLARKATMMVDISDAAAGARDVRLFRDGALVKVWRGDVLRGGRTAKLEAQVTLTAGENRFAAYAFNRDNVKSVDATLVVTGDDGLKRKGVAHVLAIGVNRYSNQRYNLSFAVADAESFAEEFKRQQQAVGRFERVELIRLFDDQATKANVLSRLAELSAKVQPEDAVVVYFAGHGTAQKNRFYLLAHDLGYAGSPERLNRAALQNILAHAVSDRELERAFEKMDAGNFLLVIDACNSGQALESEEKRRGPMNSKGLAQLAYEKGMYILTASQSYEAALEASKLGHGLLTYALVEEGLKRSAADRKPADGSVVLREWLEYAATRVPDMQIDEMKRARTRGKNLSFAAHERSLDLAKRSGQRPRLFYRPDPDIQPLIIATTPPKQ